MEQLEATFVASRRALLGYIKKKVSDPDLAEDILQDGLLKALRKAPELREEERMLPWLYTILNNAITDHYRHAKVERAWLGNAIAEAREEAVEQEELAALCGCFRDILPSLRPEEAELIEELEMGEGDPAEVADRLGITRNNLKVRRHRARAALRRRLEETCRSCATHGCLDCSCAK